MSGLPNEKRRAPHWMNGVRDYVARFELAVLVAIAVVAGGAWVFLELADEVIEGSTAGMDRTLLLALRAGPQNLGDPLGPLWFEEMMRDLTALGGFAILTLLTIGVVVFLLLQDKPHAALLVVAVIVGGTVLMSLLKEIYGRPRPDLVPHGSYVTSDSFPSGHSLLSAAVYLTLGALLARFVAERRLKIYFLSVAVVLTVLVGVSRVYLGVHWPTDVLAGWTVGAMWAAACWLAARWLQRRGRVEPGDEPDWDA